MRNLVGAIALPTLDLAVVCERVAKEHPEWSPERVSKAETEYRRFLALIKAHPGEPLAPLHDTDEVWHAHILFTKKYVEDCKVFFGFYLHHEPLDWSTQSEEARSLTGQHYLEAFGETYGAETECKVDCTSCLSSCSGGRIGAKEPEPIGAFFLSEARAN